MAKVYLVWKDSACNGINPEWIRMTGREFFSFLRATEQERYFITLDDGGEQGMSPIVIETTKENYLEWNREHQKAKRRKKAQKDYKPMLVSLDSLADNEKT